MALNLPQMPNFQTNIPQPQDPMQKYGQMLALKNMLGQQKLLPLQMQEEQQRVQQANISTEMQQTELDSQKAMMSAIAGGDLNKYVGVDTPDGTGFDAAGAYTHLVKSGVLPTQASQYVSNFQTIGKNNSEIMKNRSQAGEAAMNLRSKGSGELADGLAPILDMKDPSKADEALTNFKQELAKNPVPGVDRNDLALLYGADLAHLPAIATQLNLHKQLADYHKGQAEATAAQEKLPGGALSPEKVAEAEANNPVIQGAKLALSEAEGRARANVEIQTKRGSNPNVANVAPQLVEPAISAATKADMDFAQAQSVSQRLEQMMQAAKNGNVVSYQLIPQEGALQVTTSQGVHRINMAEIQNYGGGSAWQKMEGHFGKALMGKSIPASVLNDMTEMQRIQAEGSRSKYENSISAINDRFGSSFKPMEMPTEKPSGGKTSRFSVQAPNGKTYSFKDQKSLDAFKKAAAIQ